MKKVGVAEPSALSAPGQNEGGGSGSAARPANREPEAGGVLYKKSKYLLFTVPLCPPLQQSGEKGLSF